MDALLLIGQVNSLNLIQKASRLITFIVPQIGIWIVSLYSVYVKNYNHLTIDLTLLRDHFNPAWFVILVARQ